MGIGEGETRASAAWARILARTELSARVEVLDISDNFSAVAVTTRGRAAPSPSQSSVTYDSSQRGSGPLPPPVYLGGHRADARR